MDIAVWDLRDEVDMTEFVLVRAEESEEALNQYFHNLVPSRGIIVIIGDSFLHSYCLNKRPMKQQRFETLFLIRINLLEAYKTHHMNLSLLQ